MTARDQGHYPYQATPNFWVTPGHFGLFNWKCARCGIGGGGFESSDEALADAEKHMLAAYENENPGGIA